MENSTMNALNSECPRKPKSGKLQKIDFLLTKPIEEVYSGVLG